MNSYGPLDALSFVLFKFSFVLFKLSSSIYVLHTISSQVAGQSTFTHPAFACLPFKVKSLLSRPTVPFVLPFKLLSKRSPSFKTTSHISFYQPPTIPLAIMKFSTLATLAISATMATAYVVPGQDWTGEKRSPAVVPGVDFDETGASTAPAKREAEAWVVPGVTYDAEAEEKRGYQDGTFKRDAWVVPGVQFDEAEEKRSYHDGTYKRWVVPGVDYNGDAEEKRSYHDGTFKRDAEAEEAEAKRSYQDGTFKRDAKAEEEAKRSYHDGTY